MKTESQVLESQHNNYVGSPQNLSTPALGVPPGSWVNKLDPSAISACLNCVEVHPLHLLGFLVAVTHCHQAGMVASVLPKIKDPWQRALFVQALQMAQSLAGLSLCLADPAKIPLSAPTPHRVLMPGLTAAVGGYTYEDALEFISSALARHAPAVAALAQSQADPFEAVQIAQALLIAEHVYLACGPDADFAVSAEPLFLAQLNRWIALWAEYPAAEDTHCQLRARHPGQTLAQINGEKNAADPAPKAKGRAPSGRHAKPARRVPVVTFKNA